MFRKTIFALAALFAIVFSVAGNTSDAEAKRGYWKGGGYKIHVIHRGHRFYRPRHVVRFVVLKRKYGYRTYGYRSHFRFGSHRIVIKRATNWRCIALQKRGYRIYCA